MKVVKKLNDNVGICLDSENNEIPKKFMHSEKLVAVAQNKIDSELHVNFVFTFAIQRVKKEFLPVLLA